MIAGSPNIFLFTRLLIKNHGDIIFFFFIKYLLSRFTYLLKKKNEM